MRVGWGILLSLSLAVSAQPGYKLAYRTDFSRGLDPNLWLQGPSPASFRLIPFGGVPALCIRLRRDERFEGVANGAPRAEVSFSRVCRLRQGVDYRLSWSTLLPADYLPDMQQPEGLSQIHGGPNQGVPPFSLTVVHGGYEVELRNGSGTQSRPVGPLAGDLGHWVRWQLHYRADPQGRRAVTELFKNGSPAASCNGVPNAYPGDDQAYFKMGLYKWWWQQRPSDVSERVLYFGDVTIEEGGG